LEVAVKEGDEVTAGQPLGTLEGATMLVSPVAGVVEKLTLGADARGTADVPMIVLKPGDAPAAAVFEPLDPESAPVADLWERMDAAGIITNASWPARLSDVIGPGQDGKPATLVVTASDSEPELVSAVQALLDRPADTCKAAAMLGRMAGAGKTILAVPQAATGEAGKACGASGVEVLPLSDRYPETLLPMIARRVGGFARFVHVETALAALDAVVLGRVQDTKLITAVGPELKAVANYRVAIGAPMSQVLEKAGFEVGEGDKVLSGSYLRGVAQAEIEAPVDAGVSGVTLFPAAKQVMWTNEPCVGCGACVNMCPAHLQPHMLGRFSEYSLFERTEEFGLHHCIGCGLCGVVCPAHRPLLQWIRLARGEVRRLAEEARVRELEQQAAADAPATVDESGDAPAQTDA